MATRAGDVPGSQSQSSPASSGTQGNPQGTDPANQGANGGSQGGSGTPAAPSYKVGDRTFNSPEEMATHIAQLTVTVREQGRALNDLANRAEGVQPTTQPSVAQGGQAGQRQDGGDVNAAFWNDPVGVLRREMSAMIEPFQRDLNETRRETAYDKLRREFKRFSELEPMIEAMMTRTNQARTYDNLRAAYFMVRGYMEETGQTSTGQPGDQQDQVQNQNQPFIPPQHTPSAAPLPQNQGGQQKKRSLTENERRIAREGGYTDEQYLALIELDEEEVVTTTIGRPAAS